MKKILLILITLIFTVTACSITQDYKDQMIEQGDKLVSKIEAYQRTNNHLPNSLSDIGITEKLEGPFFYDRKTNDQFQLWFGVELGESCIYDSSRRTWK